MQQKLIIFKKCSPLSNKDISLDSILNVWGRWALRDRTLGSSCLTAAAPMPPSFIFPEKTNSGQLPVKGQQKPCTTMTLFEWCEENLPRIRMESSPTGKQVGDYSLLSLQRHCQTLKHMYNRHIFCATVWPGGWGVTVMPNCMLGFFIKHLSSIWEDLPKSSGEWMNSILRLYNVAFQVSWLVFYTQSAIMVVSGWNIFYLLSYSKC